MAFSIGDTVRTTTTAHTATGTREITRTHQVIATANAAGMYRLEAIGASANPWHPGYLGMYSWAHESDMEAV